MTILGRRITIAFLRAWDWAERAKQRRALLRLDHRALADMGLSACDAQHEYDKWFWRA
ncbi:MAG: DUF1127 domain-containing protein [Caulobacter sp.]|nr:DUF1127 domain-containing protein [Caulobacter sp.]